MTDGNDQDRIKRLLKEAKKKSDAEDYEGCIAILNEIIIIDPKNIEALNNRGFARNKLGKYKDGIEDLNKAIDLDPENETLWYNRGYAKYKLGLKEKAFDDLEQSFLLNPESDKRRRSMLGMLELKKLDEIASKNVEGLDKETEILMDRSKQAYWTSLVYYLAVITVMVLFLLWLGLLMDVINDYFPQFEKVNIISWTTKLDATTALPFFTAITFLSIPFIWGLRILIRAADEYRILSDDYFRRYIVEKRVFLFRSFIRENTSDAEMLNDYLNNWMVNSPIETLMKLRNRNSNIQDHPTETLLKKCASIFRKPPQNP